MRIVLLGPPGAGKGTQAAKIAAHFKIPHLSSGDILRAERATKSELGMKAQEYMDRGALVPDDLILAMMMEHIARPEAEGGYLLDGFPRTQVQAERLDELLEDAGRALDCAVLIDVPNEVVEQRLTGRWSCPQNGRVYHEVYSPPSKKGICDECGAALTRRRDDEPDVVRQRLKTYQDQTRPLVDYYRGKGLLASVDGATKVATVTAAIVEVCKTR